MAKRKLPPSYGYNVFTSMTREKLDQPYSGRASERQLLANELEPYKLWLDDQVRADITKVITGVNWWYIPDIVHCMVCPTCTPWGTNHILDRTPRVLMDTTEDLTNYEWEPTDDPALVPQTFHQPTLFGD